MPNTPTLKVYNTLTRKKEFFEPLNPPYVGLYVCGPTVYNDVHLGNVRTFLTFDIVYRYLAYLGYKVRYVRNITDVGHLQNDADSGEDKIAKRAKLENLEPMEVVHKYTRAFHRVMATFNILSPGIEPSASGHILEQIEMVQRILNNGLAYESNGSVYFDVPAYSKKYEYGKLSGRKIDELLTATRDLEGQDEKRSPLDFAIWKKAEPSHIMRWNSPWGEGFPGWHLECSVMSTKYLGLTFDIHGGGMDLKFPHHECEIAQSVAADGTEPVRYWLHSNMLTVNGRKMAKSEGNGFTPEELITGNHPLLEKGYHPMVVRFFMLQSHYSSTLDFSNEALQAAEKGYHRLMNALAAIDSLPEGDGGEVNLDQFEAQCAEAMNDDFNTPVLIAHLFELSRVINQAKDGKLSISKSEKIALQELLQGYVLQVLGLQPDADSAQQATAGHEPELVELLLEIRRNAKAVRNFDLADQIRNRLTALNIELKDTPSGTEWSIK